MSSQSIQSDVSPQVYVSLDDLVNAKYEARGFSFMPKYSVTSILSGSHASRLRGRGLDFEEVRAYVPGDDIRTIDWKVTARVKKPHTKVYTEERERPALIIVDQSSTMFFGSRYALKSVIAAKMAALSAWRILSQDDRVGGLIFNDTDVVEVKPKRDRRAVLRFLGLITEMNHKLSVQAYQHANPAMLNSVLHKALAKITHDYLVLVVSDFAHADAETMKLLSLMTRNNDVVAARIFDPMEQSLPAASLVMSDGVNQMALEGSEKKIRSDFTERAKQETSRLTAQFKKYKIIHMPFSTESSVTDQLKDMVGQRLRTK